MRDTKNKMKYVEIMRKYIPFVSSPSLVQEWCKREKELGHELHPELFYKFVCSEQVIQPLKNVVSDIRMEVYTESHKEA